MSGGRRDDHYDDDSTLVDEWGGYASFCGIHKPLFARLFRTRERNFVGDDSDDWTDRKACVDSHNWQTTRYAKSVIRHGRLPTRSEVAATTTTGGDGAIQRRRRKQRRVRALATATATAAAISSSTSSSRCYVVAADRRQLDEIRRANEDPCRDTIAYAATNHRMFTVGGERCVVSIYRALWRLMYDTKRFGDSCECTTDALGVRATHTIRRAATYPWRAENDVVARLAYNGDFSESATTVSRLVFPPVSGDPSVSIGRIDEYPYDAEFRRRDDASRSEWWSDVCASWTIERRCPATTPASNDGVRSVVKLLDYRFTNPRHVWSLVIDLLDWAERVRDDIGFYPVRRSVWDLIAFDENVGGGGTNDNVRFAAIGGLVDIGDSFAFAYTLRILVLALYLGCCYGGMARAANVNDRVSNRAHRCAFPAKTSGIYYELFHTSVLPHRLFCRFVTSRSQRQQRRRVRRSAVTTESSASRDSRDDDEDENLIRRVWFRDFTTLCRCAAERYGLPTPKAIRPDDQTDDDDDDDDDVDNLR